MQREMLWWRIDTLKLKERTEYCWKRCLILCNQLNQTFTIHKELKNAVWTEKLVKERVWKLQSKTKLSSEDYKTSKQLTVSQDGRKTIKICAELEIMSVNSHTSLEMETASIDRCSVLHKRVGLSNMISEVDKVIKYRCLTFQEQPQEIEVLADTILCNQISAVCLLNLSPKDLSLDKLRHWMRTESCYTSDQSSLVRDTIL